MIEFDASKLAQREIYKLMVGAIIPRPVALVSSISNQGVGNLAPFSFFNGVSSSPPCLMISVTGKPDGQPKDTLRNILETGEFVVNSYDAKFLKQFHQTSANYAYGIDELTTVGLTPIPSVKVRPFRVKESSIHMECKVQQTVTVGQGGRGSSTLVIGEILLIHVAEDVYRNGEIDPELFRPIARLGGDAYSELGKFTFIPRPTI